jgi:nucleoside-diphosphate-sugar epimerase
VKSILVTGGAGFIGSSLVRGCLSEGWTVDVVDDLSNGHRVFLPEQVNGHRIRDFFQSDFTGGTSFKRLSNGLYDVVFHLAAIPRVSYSVEYPLQTHDVNVNKTLKLLDACRRNGTRVVFASSSSVYGGAVNGASHENDRKHPKSPYALQKSIIEDYLALFGDLYDLRSTSLRFFNVFGDRALGSSPYATALAAWLTAIKQNKPLRFDGDGTQTRDMCHVDNVVRACILAAKIDTESKTRVYNVACGKSTSNNALLQRLLKRYPDAKMIEAPWRAGDVKHTLADTTRITEELGYRPKTDVWAGVDKTCDWYDANWESVKALKAGV